MLRTIIFLITLSANGSAPGTIDAPAVAAETEVEVDCVYLVRPNQPMILLEGDPSC